MCMYACLCMRGMKAHSFVRAEQDEVNVLADNAQKPSFTVNIQTDNQRPLKSAPLEIFSQCYIQTHSYPNAHLLRMYTMEYQCTSYYRVYTEECLIFIFKYHVKQDIFRINILWLISLLVYLSYWNWNVKGSTLLYELQYHTQWGFVQYSRSNIIHNLCNLCNFCAYFSIFIPNCCLNIALTKCLDCTKDFYFYNISTSF